MAWEHLRPAFLLCWQALELDLTRLHGRPLIAEACGDGQCHGRDPGVAVRQIGALGQRPPVAVNLLATSRRRARI